MANVTVIGGQWGDEGKGKIVDWLASRAEIVARFQGGHNAGHTLVVGNQTYKLSLLPSGIVRGTPSVIGNGVVLDPWALKAEIERLEEQGVDAAGDTGEAEPALAIEDALATFKADRIVVFSHPEGDRDYREDEGLANAEERFGVPLTHALISR